MSYYDNKRKAYLLIDEMITDGKNFDQIRFKVATMFGFGTKIIEDRIEMIKKSQETETFKNETA